MRGYFGIGLYHPKTKDNLGTLWRSAMLYGADFLFTIASRYSYQPTDTLRATRHIPLWHFTDYSDFETHLPENVTLMCVELHQRGESLPTVRHPHRAVYLLGAEDTGLPAAIMERQRIISIPSAQPFSLNVAVAGTIVMYDRYLKMRTNL